MKYYNPTDELKYKLASIATGPYKVIGVYDKACAIFLDNIYNLIIFIDNNFTERINMHQVVIASHGTDNEI